MDDRSGREPEGTSLPEGHRSLRVQLVSGANQPDHNDIIRATALEGHGLVFLGRVPTPTAAALVRSCPAGVGDSFSRRLAMARPGGLGLRPGLMLTWPWSVLLCPGLWALRACVCVGATPGRSEPGLLCGDKTACVRCPQGSPEPGPERRTQHLPPGAQSGRSCDPSKLPYPLLLLPPPCSICPYGGPRRHCK